MRLVWAALFMLLTSGMIALQTYLIKPILDKVIIGKDMRLGLLLPPALIIVSILKGITWYARDYFMGYVGQKVVNDIRDRLYSHIQTLSFSYFTRTPTGVIISRIINDVNLVHFSYKRYLENRFRETFGFDGTPIRLLFKARGEKC
jgi:subfamily B ATP-binding cassette protein MsbA